MADEYVDTGPFLFMDSRLILPNCMIRLGMSIRISRPRTSFLEVLGAEDRSIERKSGFGVVNCHGSIDDQG